MKTDPKLFREIEIGQSFGKAGVLYRKETERLGAVVRWEDGEEPSGMVFHHFDDSELVIAFGKENSPDPDE